MTDSTAAIYGTTRTLDPQIVLGVLSWYNVTNVRVPHATAVAAHARLGLGRSLPGEPTDGDVFRRVCSKAGEKGVATQTKGVSANYLLRPVGPKLRRLVKELVNEAGEKLDYTPLADVRFDPLRPASLSSTPTGDADGERILAELEENYLKWRGCLDSYAIREWIRGTFQDMRAVQVKAGVYFLGKEHQSTLDDIERFGLEIPGQVKVRTLPLVDDLKQREMVREAFETEADAAMDALWTQLESDIDNGRELTLAAWESRRDEFAELIAKKEGLSELLEQQLLTSDARTNMLQRMLNELYKSVKKETK